MDSTPQQLLIVGLADAGKTSFIHAVDDLLHHPAADDALRASGLAADRTYLEKEKSLFRAGEELERTKRTPLGAPPELWFEDPKSGIKGRLFLPDVSGEIYRDQWVNRVWDKAYADSLKQVAGILLFARADLAASNAELLGSLINPDKSADAVKDWDPRKASAQVQLVDILQFIATRGDFARPLRVGVIFSAWDTIAKMGAHAPTPEAFLRSDWALLDQYLSTNADTFATRIYGVSALGGTREELLELRKLPPADRVKLVEGKDVSRDLTKPLRWLLRLT